MSGTAGKNSGNATTSSSDSRVNIEELQTTIASVNKRAATLNSSDT